MGSLWVAAREMLLSRGQYFTIEHNWPTFKVILILQSVLSVDVLKYNFAIKKNI